MNPLTLINKQARQIILSCGNLQEKIDCLALQIDGFCGNNDFLNGLSQEDVNLYGESVNAVCENENEIEIRLIKCSSGSAFSHLICVPGNNSKFYINNKHRYDNSGWKDYYYAVTREG